MWRRAAQVHFWILYRGGRPIPHPSKPSLNHSSGAHAVTIEKGLVQGEGILWRRSIAGVICPYRESYLTFAFTIFFDFRGIPPVFVRNVEPAYGTVAGSCQKTYIDYLKRSTRPEGRYGLRRYTYGRTAAPAAAGGGASACSSCILTVRDHRVREPVLWLRVRQRGPWRAEPLHFASHHGCSRASHSTHRAIQYALALHNHKHTYGTHAFESLACTPRRDAHSRATVIARSGKLSSVVPRLCLS